MVSADEDYSSSVEVSDDELSNYSAEASPAKKKKQSAESLPPRPILQDSQALQEIKKRDRRIAELEEELRRVKAQKMSPNQSSVTAFTAGSAKAQLPALSDEQVQKSVKQITSSLTKSLQGQMVYKPSLKQASKGARLEAEVPNVGESVARAFIGQENFKCTAKTKVVRFKGFELPISKGLRYGAALAVTKEGLSVEWKREAGTLRVYGKYYMDR